MSKRKITVEFAEAIDDGYEIRLRFNRKLSRLEADGILLRVKEGLERQ